MKINFFVGVMGALSLISSCSDGSLTGATGSKQAKRTSADNESDDASKPEVVTGAYLACIQLDSIDPKEHSFGCSVKDKDTNEKVDVTSFKTTLVDSNNKSVKHRVELKNLALTDDNQALIFFPVDAGRNLKLAVSAKVMNKPAEYGKDFSQEITLLSGSNTVLNSAQAQTKAIGLATNFNASLSAIGNKSLDCDVVRQNVDKSPPRAFDDPSNGGCFTDTEVRTWCNEPATKKGLSNGLMPNLTLLGTACGMDYVKSKQSLFNFFLPDVKDFAVKVTTIFGKQISDEGACERVGLTSLCANNPSLFTSPSGSVKTKSP